MKKIYKTLFKTLLTFCLALHFYSANATVHYVKTTATGTANASSWANASADLQAIINTANAGDSIWVASGTYKPTKDLFGSNMPASNRFKCFALKDGVQLFGGFIGTEASFVQRQVQTNITVLSGDLNGDDIAVPVPNSPYATNTNITDNVYHIMLYAKDIGLQIGCTIDGFTFIGGAANITSLQVFKGQIIQTEKGAALALFGGTHIVRNNTFLHNTTSTFGSGIFCVQTANVLIENNTFTQNNSVVCTINSSVDTNLIINKNTFTANIATNGAGAILSDGGSVGLDDNIFELNKGVYGACAFGNSTISGQNNVFIKNHGTQAGGAIGTNGAASSFYFTHCTFYNNTSDAIGQTFTANFDAYATLANCILQGNGLQLEKNNSSTLDLTTCIISGGDSTCNTCPNTNGNIYAQFMDTTNLIGADGLWRTADDGLNLLISSPANSISLYTNITTTQDIKGSTRPTGNGSIGAYQYSCGTPKVFVNTTATGNNTGSSWVNAFTSLQSALNSCADTIWVAAGTYKPSVDAFGNVPINVREKIFLIPDGKKIFGGFNGTETILDQRSIYTNLTTISTDINNNDATTGNTGNNLNFVGNTENNYHAIAIFTDTLNSGGVVLDGFTIKAGNTTGATNIITPKGTILSGSGAGVFIKGGTHVVDNCKIIGGLANNGGAIAVIDGGHYFRNDSLINNYGFSGGAIYSENTVLHADACVSIANNSQYGAGFNLENSVGLIDSCTFISNGDAFYGGALYCNGSDQYITNSNFVSNASVESGGAIYSVNSGTFIENNIFKENYSGAYGAALSLHRGGVHNIKENIFELNYAVTSGGGIYLGDTSTNVYITNNVFASNTAVLSGAGVNITAACQVFMHHNTFYNNEGFYPNSGFYSAASASVEFGNNIFWRNKDTYGIPIAQFENNATTTIATNNIATTSAAPLNGNPNFINQTDVNGADNIYFTADDGLNVQSTSIAINAGANLYTGFDILGITRNTITPTIGAYEFYVPIFSVQGTAGILECSSDTTHILFTTANATGTVTITPIATGLGAGIYTFTATDAANVTATTIVEIQAAGAFSVTPIQTQFQQCFGDSIILSATISPNITNVNYTWRSDDYSVIHNHGFNYLDYNIFTIVASNSKGTCIDSAVMNNVYAQNLNLVLSGTASLTGYANGSGAAAINIPTPDGATVTYKNQFAITYCDVIATVQDAIGGNVLGNVTAYTIIKTDSVITNNNLHYVKRPVKITPSNNGAAMVTLYFTQTELALYNEYVQNNYASNQAFSIPNLFTYGANNGDSITGYITKVQGNAIDSGGTINAVIPVSIKYNNNWGLWTCTFPVSSFSYFYLSGSTNNTPLNINDVTINATVIGDSDKIIYKIPTINNYKFLELQQSTDGNNFTTIHQDAVSTITQFEFISTYINATKNYYRVKSITKNNTNVYSKIATTNRVANNTIAVYPNPIKSVGILEINSIKNAGAIVKIYNSLGELVYTIHTALQQGVNKINLPTQQFASGIYHAKVSCGNHTQLQTTFTIE